MALAMDDDEDFEDLDDVVVVVAVVVIEVVVAAAGAPVGAGTGKLVGDRVTTTLEIELVSTVKTPDSVVLATSIAMFEVRSVMTVVASAVAEVSVTVPSDTTTSKLTSQVYEVRRRGMRSLVGAARRRRTAVISTRKFLMLSTVTPVKQLTAADLISFFSVSEGGVVELAEMDTPTDIVTVSVVVGVTVGSGVGWGVGC